ncbi:hypothetical protein IRT38_12295 [Acinetobacter sp. SK-43]|uniref:hypothetical protein n=1 Tax=Acinetobacter sp. SK-43 TaxID=2785295 RepID=UPI00188CE84B|nr:hypothetical protein [Acinetobacter sp. SK-43]MBF4456138.1 hypothetical protein [Acinetobacter sp. SK-43]
MISNQIKPDYSEEVAKFVANGGQIQMAVNTNKTEFNYCNADTVLQSTERPNSHQNHILRTRAEKQNLKSYKPVAPCKSCGTSERSVKSNICLECDRRRARFKTGLSLKNLEAVGHYLLGKGESIEFTSGGQKYILKVEVA